MICEIETEAALYAKKILVDAAQVAVIGAKNFMVADAERGLAAVRAVRANSGDVLHLPRPRFVAISAAGERTDGANVNAHAAFFAFEVVFAIRDDDAVRAAHPDAEGFDVHAFIADAHA